MPIHPELIKVFEEMGHQICKRCNCCDLVWQECRDCEDGLSGHDCGEDVCCCLDPDDNMICDTCGGRGGWQRCIGRCDEHGQHQTIPPPRSAVD